MRIDLDDIERKALAATLQNIDAAEIIEGDEGKTIECPACSGEGYVSLEGDYCNFDGCAIGVQFYGVGNEHGAAERYYRAANPTVVLELVRRLREAEAEESCDDIELADLILSDCGISGVATALKERIARRIAKHMGSATPCQGHARQQEAEETEQLRKDAERYRLLKRGQHWSTVNGVGDTLRGEALDQAIDAALATQEAKSGD